METKRPQNWPVLGSPPCQGHCTPLGIFASSAELHPLYQIVHLCTWKSVYPIQNCHTASTASQSCPKGTKQISSSGDMKGKETFPRWCNKEEAPDLPASMMTCKISSCSSIQIPLQLPFICLPVPSSTDRATGQRHRLHYAAFPSIPNHED